MAGVVQSGTNDGDDCTLLSVSTADQDLPCQRQRTSAYATDRLGVEPAEIELFVDTQSGTNTDREGYRELMAAIADGGILQVIASEVSRISRSVRDFSATVERIVDEHGVGLHILDMGIALDPHDSDPYTRAFLTVAATFAELDAEIKRQNVREGIAAAREQGEWHGRPPFGFDVGSEGYLVPNDGYEKAGVVLDELAKGTSKRSVA